MTLTALAASVSPGSGTTFVNATPATLQLLALAASVNPGTAPGVVFQLAKHLRAVARVQRFADLARSTRRLAIRAAARRGVLSRARRRAVITE